MGQSQRQGAGKWLSMPFRFIAHQAPFLARRYAAATASNPPVGGSVLQANAVNRCV